VQWGDATSCFVRYFALPYGNPHEENQEEENPMTAWKIKKDII
jgi:hypothetical protein